MKINNKVLYCLEYLNNIFQKIRYKALLEYKTALIKKNGSNANWIGPNTIKKYS